MSPPPPSLSSKPWSQVRQLAQDLGLSWHDDVMPKLDNQVARTLSHSFARRHRFVLLGQRADGTLDAAMEDPLALEALAEAEWRLQTSIFASIVSERTLEILLRSAYEGPTDFTCTSAVASCPLGNAGETSSGQVHDLLDIAPTSASSALFNTLVCEAIAQGASDVHLECAPRRIALRYRIDGVLCKRPTPTDALGQELIVRIKLLAGLDIAERRRPQEGRIQVRFGRRKLDLRVGILPIFEGEKVALRILDGWELPRDLSALHLPPRALEQLRAQIHGPQGLILVCGPTGSGKSTTLQCALRELLEDGKNVMSVEDPIEFTIPEISQLAVRPDLGLDFASGLRHLLRQDPDVLLVGEIRDEETAYITLRAALTGHLVLSTLHTANAHSAITRLLDMQLEPFVLASSLTGILAQRLVRLLCAQCKRPRRASPSEHSQLSFVGLDSQTPLFEPQGCTHCHQTGFRGRCALFEWLPIEDELRERILQRFDGAPPQVLGSLEALQRHGEQLVYEGITSFAELRRVLQGPSVPH